MVRTPAQPMLYSAFQACLKELLPFEHTNSLRTACSSTDSLSWMPSESAAGKNAPPSPFLTPSSHPLQSTTMSPWKWVIRCCSCSRTNSTQLGHSLHESVKRCTTPIHSNLCAAMHTMTNLTGLIRMPTLQLPKPSVTHIPILSRDPIQMHGHTQSPSPNRRIPSSVRSLNDSMVFSKLLAKAQVVLLLFPPRLAMQKREKRTSFHHHGGRSELVMSFFFLPLSIHFSFLPPSISSFFTHLSDSPLCLTPLTANF